MRHVVVLGKRRKPFLVLWCCLMQAVMLADSSSVCQNDETKLRALLFDGTYNPSVRPVNDSKQPVDVKIGIALTNVLDLSVVTGVAHLAVWLRASWYDPSLDWNSSQHNGIWQLTEDVSNIWTPDFLAYNHVERFEKETRHEMTQVWLYGDGWGVYWSRPAVIRIACSIDATEFPFDAQSCDIDIGGWSMSGLLQNLSPMAYTINDDKAADGKRRVSNGEIDVSVFKESSEYAVTTASAQRRLSYYACCPTEPWPVIKFKLTLGRKSWHYVLNVILPTAVTTVISMTTFILPHETGERIGLGVTCILVVCAIMFVSTDLVPISDDSTVLGTFYTGCFFYALGGLLLTVVSAALYHQRDDIDFDGEAGSYFLTEICGISSQMAVQFSFRIDFYSMIIFPITFAMFCVVVLNPDWGTGAKVLACVLLLLGTVMLMGLAFLALQAFRRFLKKDVLSLRSVFWRFRRNSLSDVTNIVPNARGQEGES